MLAGPIEGALEAVRSAIDLRAGFEPATSTRTFRIVMTEGAAAFYLPQIVPAFKQTAPGIDVVALQMSRERYREALELGTVELALGQIPNDIGMLHGQHLWDEELVCLLRRDHPTIGDSITMDQFMATEQITVSAPAQAETLVRKALGKRAARRRVALSLPYYMVVPMVLSKSDLIAVMPLTCCALFLDEWGLKTLPLPFKVPPMHMGQIWHSRSHHDAGHAWLRSTIAEMFGERP
jgi:DNA-binding transcriptional LysR family regulator